MANWISIWLVPKWNVVFFSPYKEAWKNWKQVSFKLDFPLDLLRDLLWGLERCFGLIGRVWWQVLLVEDYTKSDSGISFFGIFFVWSSGIGWWFCLFFLKRIEHFVSRRGPKRRIIPKGHMNKWSLLYFPCHRRIKSWVIIAAHLEFVACAFLMELERK